VINALEVVEEVAVLAYFTVLSWHLHEETE
jgi:hypothetical protein